MKRWILIVVAAAAVGCGSSDGGNPDGGSTGSGTANGTVNGHSLTVREVVFGIDSTNVVFVGLADRTDICTLLASNTPPTGDTTALILGMVNLGPASIPVGLGTGTYNWNAATTTPPPGLYWQGDFGVGTGCTLTNDTPASGGTITVTQVGNKTGTHLKGSYNATFGSDTLSGAFDAVYCDALVNPGTSCDTLRARPVVLR